MKPNFLFSAVSILFILVSYIQEISAQTQSYTPSKRESVAPVRQRATMNPATLNSILLQQQNAIRTPKSVSDAFSSQQLDMGLPQEQPMRPPAASSAPVAQTQAKYGFEAHEQRRLAAQEYAHKTWGNFATSSQGMVSEERNSHFKTVDKLLESRFNKEDLKPFEETPAYKQAMEARLGMLDSINRQRVLEKQIETFKAYLAKGDKDGAMLFARITIVQTQNLLTGQNAIQPTELNALLKEPPDKLLKSVIDTANTNAEALNAQMMEFVIKPTSPEIAGFKLFKRIAQLEAVNN